MHAILLLQFLTADTHVKYSARRNYAAMQYTLMEKLIEHVDRNIRFEILNNDLTAAVCDWGERTDLHFRVLCHHGAVLQILVEDIIEQFAIGFAPHTVQEIIMRRCDQRSVFDVRHLPGALRSIDMSTNRYRGRLELPALPRRLQKFIASSNRLSGSIVFRDLPRTLTEINLSWNPLRVDIVYFDDLPRKLERVSLQCAGVGKVRPVHRKSRGRAHVFAGVGTAYMPYETFLSFD